MGKKFIAGLLISILTISLWGQEVFDAEKKFYDANFNTLYNRYQEALDLYLELYNKGYQNENICYLIGKTYFHIPGLKIQAIPWLEKAVQRTSAKYNTQSFRESRSPLEAWLLLGQAYQVNNELEKAREAYNSYKRAASKAGKDTETADRYLTSCDTAEKFLSLPRDAEITDPAFLRVSDINYNVAVSADGKTIVFMSDMKYYHAIFFTQFVDGHWTNPRNITMELESDGKYSVSSLSADGRILLLSVPAGNNGTDIFISHFFRNRWIPARPLSKKINSFHNETYAFLSADQKTLLFVSDRPGGGGGLDIYEARKTDKDIWDNIENLGTPVNTSFDENTPYLTTDGRKLYFSSNGHYGMGGYDVFVSERKEATWGNPVNLGHPPNTTDDDLHYFPVESEFKGYMAVFGKEDKRTAEIKSFEFFSGEHPRTYTITGKVTLPVKESAGEKAVLAVYYQNQPGKIVKKEEITFDSTFELQLPAGQYILNLSSPYIESFSKPFFVYSGTKKNFLEIKPSVPEKTKPHIRFEIAPVYFGFDKATINPGDLVTLQTLKTAMDSLPAIVLVIEGHTDEIGPSSYNQRLSERRARSVADYLVGHGISSERIITKGYGETKPVAINHWPDGKDCPEGRKLNRRVTFDIKGTDTLSLKFVLPEIPEKLLIHSK